MSPHGALLIREATSDADYDAFGRLIRDYVDWCRVRYRDIPWLVEMAFGYQSLDRELEMLRVAYGPPKGKALLAFINGEIAGCVAYRSLGDGVCEMKRMFVPETSHGKGIGRRLADAIVAQATADGFSRMKLDTGRGQTEAIAMYRSMGFAPCDRYTDYPERMTPLMVFMERPLAP